MENLSETCVVSNKSLARTIIFKILAKIRFGQITIIENGEQTVFKGKEGADTHTASVTIYNKNLYKELLLTGTNGAADSYIMGEWSCPQLTTLIEIILINEEIFQKIDNRFSGVISAMKNLLSVINKNHKTKAKKNILAHYDLGNDFFKLFLDDRMMYSSGVYESEKATLEDASTYKLRLIAEALQLTTKDHILEIGTGWGGFAIFAAQEYGCKVTTTTISDRQYLYVKNKINTLGLDSQITLLNQDYRELQGQYDKLVSIEMIEAVGHQFFHTFFAKCNSLVKSGGMFFLQAITINDGAFHKAKREIDFIKRYIFPGGCLPSKEIINQCIKRHTQMQLLNWRQIGLDYYTTLMNWRDRFFSHKETIKKLGFSDSFIRTWDLYFCYCAAGFKQRYIDNAQVLWQKMT